jgi:hypothetical protein
MAEGAGQCHGGAGHARVYGGLCDSCRNGVGHSCERDGGVQGHEPPHTRTPPVVHSSTPTLGYPARKRLHRPDTGQGESSP